MKVAINIQADIQEIKVIINCMAEDENVQRIVSALDSLNTKLCCRRQGELFQIALNDILYIESVDRKTFIYTEQQIYDCLLYTSPSPRDVEESRMPSSA